MKIKNILMISGLLCTLFIPNIYAKEKTFTSTVTAYTLAQKECGKSKNNKYYGITASMKKAVEGTTIAMSNKYKFGTKVKIEGFKHTFIVQDRGGAIQGDRIDIFMNNKKDAIRFGKKKLKVTIIE